jgi:hypothetical protein
MERTRWLNVEWRMCVWDNGTSEFEQAGMESLAGVLLYIWNRLLVFAMLHKCACLGADADYGIKMEQKGVFRMAPKHQRGKAILFLQNEFQ